MAETAPHMLARDSPGSARLGAAFYSPGREEKEKRDEMELQTRPSAWHSYSFLFFCIVKETLSNMQQTIGYISFLNIPKSKRAAEFFTEVNERGRD